MSRYKLFNIPNNYFFLHFKFVYYMNILFILDPTEMCSRVLVTCYMGSENSSEETKNRAKVDNYFSDAQLLSNYIDVRDSLCHSVTHGTLSYFVHVSVVCAPIWTFYTGLPPKNF